MKNPKETAPATGATTTASSSHKSGGVSSSDRERKSRWESPRDRDRARRLSPSPATGNPNTNPNVSRSSAAPSAAPPLAAGPAPGGPYFLHRHLAPPPLTPPPPPAYGFHNLDRRTIVLADGSVRSYFALPPDYPTGPTLNPTALDFDRRLDSFDRRSDYWPPPPHIDPAGGKRKLNDDVDEYSWQQRYVAEDGARISKHARVSSPPPPADSNVDAKAIQKAFLKFAKIVNENTALRKKLMDDAKSGPLQCIVCGRASREFADSHGLINHAYFTQNAELRIDHLGFHKAICVLMGWDYTKPPVIHKAYQSLSPMDAAGNREDLIMWPPMVIIHNTSFGRKNKDGRMEGMGNREMDAKLKELGFGGGKSKALYGKEGHLGITLVKFANTLGGLKDAERLAEYFENDNLGRRAWAHVQPLITSNVDERNPAFVKVDERTGEKKRVLYGYLATASDLETVDFETRKKVAIKTKKDLDLSD